MSSSSSPQSTKRVLERRVEIVKNRLYWISDAAPPNGFNDSFYFSIDRDLTYVPFHKDFGPHNIGNIFKYVREVERLLSAKTSSSAVLYHYTTLDPVYQTNACLLMCAFQVLVLQRSAEEAWNRFACVRGLQEYVDAGYRDCKYRCSILDCLRGLEYAVRLGWFNMATFNLKQYTFYESVDNGDLNWVVPGLFLAFSTPNDDKRKAPHSFTAEELTPVLKKFGVKLVVRLNDPLYDEHVMRRQGIEHRDIFYEDGSCPSPSHIRRFLECAEACRGAVGIHCKAGLGRTGTLIGLYLMKHYHIPAPAMIGWMRLTRPGMVLGPQQFFLCSMQEQMFEEGLKSKTLASVPRELLAKMHKVADDTSSRFERSKTPVNYYRKDAGQGERLLRMKDEHQHSRAVSANNKRVLTSPKASARTHPIRYF